MNSDLLQDVSMAHNNPKWRFAVDRGGTFTDLVGIDPDGKLHTLKLLSNSPNYEDASVACIRRVLGLGSNQTLPEDIIDSVRFGTTVATNALLERKGGNTALFITRGFSDLIEIGNQTRPDIFSLSIKKPSMLYSMVFEVDERIEQNGNVVKEINPGSLKKNVIKLKQAGIDSIAVVLLHSWKNPAHELLCEAFLKKNGFSNIFLSHKTINLIKIVTRGQSTLVDAYLSPVIAQYLESIKKETCRVPIEFIKSSGGISKPESFKGKDAILSGPAGGVIAVAKISKELRLEGAIGFDMGGTSTDVSRFDGEFEAVYEQIIGGIELQTETLNIVTVASGGGSILWFDGQKMRVGPESAGADPGPACYGFGGPLTITDANLITGRVLPEYFPRTFGPDRNSLLNVEIVAEKFRLLTEKINDSTKQKLSPQEIALGFIRIANEKMAQAIKEISISKGFDVRNYTLVCFGGAGGQHACQVASLLGMKKIIFHPLSGVMSAYGIGLSSPTEKTATTILRQYDKNTHKELRSLFEGIETQLLTQKGKQPKSSVIKRSLDLRHTGADSYLTVEYLSPKETLMKFKEKYLRLYGFWPEEISLEIVNLRVEIKEVQSYFSNLAFTYQDFDSNYVSVPSELNDQPLYRSLYYYDGKTKATVSSRESIAPSEIIKGPAIVIDRYAVLIIDPGFEAKMDNMGTLIVTCVSPENKSQHIKSHKPDPVLLEVFNNLFMGVAKEMGHTLKNTSHSVNIKERLDFSCAIFDCKGNLIANAPHIPVHLGSMADTVKAILEDKRNNLKSGDIYLTNDPYHGGSHLPDLTVISPVFSDRGGLIFFTASRGHHADVGGITPGSIPPETTNINEEGVLVENYLLVEGGKFREKEIRNILLNHKYPVRNIEESISDLKAQIASCNSGKKELEQVISKYGWDTVKDYMGYIQDNGAHCVKEALYCFIKGGETFSAAFEDYLDDGTKIKVSIKITGGANPPHSVCAVIDFTGTGPQHDRDNLNTPLSVSRSAILYVLRVLIESDIPLNSGCLRPINIIIPAGTILNPVQPAPVASGNVETSQRIVDVLLGAFGIAAASQGTMNNLLFEVEGSNPYYETIAGGSGATENCPGASGVQVHMTNTRITDPEVLEYRYAGVRLEQFKLRKGSGGKGHQKGGDGVVRELKFLKPAKVTIISERRNYPPYGMAGGGPGKRGMNYFKGKHGKRSKLPHRAEINVKANDVIRIETPGGGGFGKNPIFLPEKKK